MQGTTRYVPTCTRNNMISYTPITSRPPAHDKYKTTICFLPTHPRRTHSSCTDTHVLEKKLENIGNLLLDYSPPLIPGVYYIDNKTSKKKYLHLNTTLSRNIRNNFKCFFYENGHYFFGTYLYNRYKTSKFYYVFSLWNEIFLGKDLNRFLGGEAYVHNFEYIFLVTWA